MPKHKFENAKPIPELLDAGDYVLRITDAEDGISKGAKTRGADQIELTFREESTGKTIYDTLIFAPSLNWKIDCFIQCFGIDAAEGDEIEINSGDLVGLRGHVALKVETYTNAAKETKVSNKIATYYTEKSKLEPFQPDPFEEDDATPF